MKFSKPSLLLVSFAGLCAGLVLATSGCASDDGGDGDSTSTAMTGETATTATTATTDTTGSEPEYLFCGQASTCPPSVEGVDLTTPVSFKTDIYPILTSSCSGGSGCHATNTVTGIGFGTAAMPLDDAGMQALVTQLTTQPARLAAAVKNVEPGNWQQSFMMMKLDGCQNQSGVSCTVPSELLSYILCADSEENPNNCGDGMPQSEGTANNPNPFALPADQLNKIRAWIQQGAQFN